MTSTRRGVDAVGLRERLAAELRHDDRGGGHVDEAGRTARWRGVGSRQDGVQRRDGRHVEGAGEVDDVRAVLAAPDPVLVLDRHDVHAAVDQRRAVRR